MRVKRINIVKLSSSLVYASFTELRVVNVILNRSRVFDRVLLPKKKIIIWKRAEKEGFEPSRRY